MTENGWANQTGTNYMGLQEGNRSVRETCAAVSGLRSRRMDVDDIAANASQLIVNLTTGEAQWMRIPPARRATSKPGV